MKLVSFENNYSETIAEFEDEDKDLVIRTFIDGFPEKEEDDELYAEVIATVSTTIHGVTIVDWHDNAYRLNETVKALIKDSIKYNEKFLEKYKQILEKSDVYDTIYKQAEDMKTYGAIKNDKQIMDLIDILLHAIDERRTE